MKVLLTTLPTEGEFVNWTTPKHFQPTAVKYLPLGILSLASNLSKEYDIKLLDPPSEGWTIEETISQIEKENPRILNIGLRTDCQYKSPKLYIEFYERRKQG